MTDKHAKGALTTVRVEAGSGTYPILIGHSILSDLPALAACLSELGVNRRAIVVTDENVDRCEYADQLLTALRAAGGSGEKCVLAAGETQKTLKAFEHIVDHAVDSGMQRDGILVSVGGGVVSDITGFAAACYMRGIDFFNVPTTLLAQVDASVGGKTGVNHPNGKNLIGAFHQPLAVLIDVGTLQTLESREFFAGMAEAIKHGVIADVEFFHWIHSQSGALISGDGQALARLIGRCCEIKASVVAQDERESGIRAILNFGHSVGHALEAVTRFERYLHGEAVAIGMMVAARLSVKLTGLDESVLGQLHELLTAFDLPTSLDDDLDHDLIVKHLFLDKKNRGGKIRMVLLRELGKVEIVDDVAEADVRWAMAASGA